MTTWLCIACANHVARGKADGFMQVCHGKGAPLRRVQPLDTVIYYSPTREMGVADQYRHLTAFGRVRSSHPYQADMGGGFLPFRHDVVWEEARPVPIMPLLDHLELTRGKRNWAYPFRFGILKITDEDRDVIAAAMGVAPSGAVPAMQSGAQLPLL